MVTPVDPATARRIGGESIAFRIARADGRAATGRVRISVDYAAIEHAAGGNFATRLLLRRFPACAVTRPDDPTCLTATQVDETNDLTAKRLTADVVAAPDPSALGGLITDDRSLYALSSGSSGTIGDYAASPLLASDQWAVGAQTGNFSYMYPIPVPPAVAGPVPQLSLAYSSQSVDGRTASQNSQPSQVGEGWSFGAGQIDRRFASCANDGHATWGDLCMGKYEYFLSLNGHASELVRNGATNQWRLRDDPGWRIQSLTGASNGSNAGDYWVVTTSDGTQYSFGRGTEATTNAATNSAFNVPVFGDDAGEPCYNSASLALSYCNQVWRWNLDRITDTKGNVANLFYTKETNRYARNGSTNLISLYDRGGHLSRIEYSERSGAESATAPSRVLVTTAYRCITQTSCAAPTSNSTRSDYPDVPLDLLCESTTSCTGEGMKSPTFWSAKQINRIESQIADPTHTTTDRVDLTYTFPPTGESAVSPSLWLKTIIRTGTRETPNIAMPPVEMGGVILPNRVDNAPQSGVPETNRYRVGSILTELGGQILVDYDRPDPCDLAYVQEITGEWDQNRRNCFPQFFTPTGGSPGVGAFHKYHAMRVERRDLATQSPAQVTDYVYHPDTGFSDGAGWHHDDSLVAPLSAQSWSDYRGYERVDSRELASDGSVLGKAEYRTFRGMNGDRLVSGAARAESLSDSDGVSFTDHHYLVGRTLETQRMTPGGTVARKSQHRYVGIQTVAGPAGTTSIPHNAQYVRESNTFDKTRDMQTLSPASWLTRRVDNTYESTYGLTTTTLDYGDTGTTADDFCVKPLRNPNVTAWIIDVTHRSETYTSNCSSTTLMGRTDTYYDNQGLGVAPIDGFATEEVPWVSASKRLISRITFDSRGRVTSTVTPKYQVANPTLPADLAKRINFSYSSESMPVTTTVDAPLVPNTATTRWRDKPGTVTDGNGDAGIPDYDALGRLVSVTRPMDPAGTPGLVFTYTIDAEQNGPARVLTRELQSGTTYLDSYAYLDGWGRTRQSQLPAPNTAPTSAGGRVLVTTRYDDRGLVAAVSQPFHQTGNAGSGYLSVATPPFEAQYEYDYLGRPTKTAQHAAGALQWQTTWTHHGFSTRENHPVRGDVVRRHDAQGRVRRVEETLGATAVTTLFDYSRRGDLSAITDHHGNVASHTYDWTGRRTATTDPDQGSWSYGYDDNGNVTTVTDANGGTVTTVYDNLDRRTSQTGTGLSATWTYDATTITNGWGRLHTASRDGNTVSVLGYDDRGRPTGKRTAIGSGPLAGNYDYGFTYDLAGRTTSVTFPAAGELEQETVSTTYNGVGLADRLTGLTVSGVSTVYVDKTLYAPDGRIAGRNLGVLGGTTLATAARSYSYADPEAGRLRSTSTTATPAAGPSTVESSWLTQDAEGNVVEFRNDLELQGECFRYDALNRLVRAFTTDNPCNALAVPNHTFGSSTYDLQYTYDAIGNMTEITDLKSPANTRYMTPSAIKPHTLEWVGTIPAGRDIYEFQYDFNGAMTSRSAGGPPLAMYGYDAHHSTASIWTPTTGTTFGYNADGGMLLRTHDPNSDPGVLSDEVTTLYLDGMEVVAGGGSITATRYYGSTAFRTTTGTTADRGLWWLVNTHQNSATVTVDADTTAGGAAITRRRRYMPYGGPRDGGGLPTQHGFLGKTDDPGGLVHLGVRHYDPEIGRFLTADPVLDLADPRSLNGYAYARGNPTTLVDPSGLEPHPYADGTYGGNGCVQTCGTPVEEKVETQKLAYQGQLATIGTEIHQTRQRYAAQKKAGERSYYDAVMTGCPVNSFEMCEAYLDYRIVSIANAPDSHFDWSDFLAELSGLNDAKRCNNGSGSACFWTVAGVIPWGKAGKLGKLGTLADNVPIGFADDAVDSAFVGMKTEGGHASRHLIDEGLVPNVGPLATKVERWKEIVRPILAHPVKTFDYRVGETAARAFAGFVGGKPVVVFVAKSGELQGIVISAIIPDANQIRNMGL